jgi:hypothetical protein
MRIAVRQLSWGLAASLTTVVLLPACGANDRNSAKPPTSATAAPIAIATAPTTQSPTTKKWIDLQVGDCLADPAPTDPSIVTVTTVDCATAHRAEVYLRAPLEVNAAIADVANHQCALGFSQYTGQLIDGSPFAVTYLIDSSQDRTSANPAPSTVICLLQAANGQPLTQSARR